MAKKASGKHLVQSITLRKDFAMKPVCWSGASIALAAATLILAGAAVAPISHAEEAKGHCVGANACKGKGACKSASNDCKGHNACKGKGFLEMTKADCEKIQGASFEPAKM
jgi:hypothetical protein